MEGDFSQLDQVLTNLVENAVRHSPVEGCITVETSSDGRFAQLAVIDDGPGIDAGGSTDVFEPFVGTSSTTGLGLAICKAIVEAHGGSDRRHRARLAEVRACRSAFPCVSEPMTDAPVTTPHD